MCQHLLCRHAHSCQIPEDVSTSLCLHHAEIAGEKGSIWRSWVFDASLSAHLPRNRDRDADLRGRDSSDKGIRIGLNSVVSFVCILQLAPIYYKYGWFLAMFVSIQEMCFKNIHYGVPVVAQQ